MCVVKEFPTLEYNFLSVILVVGRKTARTEFAVIIKDKPVPQAY
jgi:hypothetical protein